MLREVIAQHPVQLEGFDDDGEVDAHHVQGGVNSDGETVTLSAEEYERLLAAARRCRFGG